MVRLVILMGPIGSILGAQTVTLWIEWAINQIQLLMKEGLRVRNFDAFFCPTVFLPF